MTFFEVAASIASITMRLVGELVGPSGCAACDARVSSPGRVLFCPPCAASVERVATSAPRTGGPACAAFEYGGAMATTIARFKYQERPDLGPRLGRVMSNAAEHLRGRVDVVVPVPLHPKRLAERGYNQAVLLARPIARSLGVELDARALRRVHDTPQQAVLDRAERLLNVRDAFVPRDSRRAAMVGARVLLVDDVRTTGATLDACAAALRSAGAKRVFALVLAQRI